LNSEVIEFDNSIRRRKEVPERGPILRKTGRRAHSTAAVALLKTGRTTFARRSTFARTRQKSRLTVVTNRRKIILQLQVQHTYFLMGADVQQHLNWVRPKRKIVPHIYNTSTGSINEFKQIISRFMARKVLSRVPDTLVCEDDCLDEEDGATKTRYCY